MTNFRFVVTGGPGAGKTTLLEALAQVGYTYVPESARAIIKARLAAGLSPRPPLPEFGQAMRQMDIAHYHDTLVSTKPVFFNRGVMDTLAFLDAEKAISPTDLKAHINQFPYNPTVFYCRPGNRFTPPTASATTPLPTPFRLPHCGSAAC